MAVVLFFFQTVVYGHIMYIHVVQKNVFQLKKLPDKNEP